MLLQRNDAGHSPSVAAKILVLTPFSLKGVQEVRAACERTSRQRT
jgi:hypothetical protein